MFPESYLSYMNNFPRAIPVTPGSYPSSMPETFPMPSPEMFDETIQQGEVTPIDQNITGGETMPQQNIPTPAPMPITTPESPFEIQPGAPAVLSTEYTQGYLRTQIGKRMRVTFLLGTNQIQDRTGVLEKVGISYIILRESETNNSTLCDIYSIKFVVIFPTGTPSM